VSTSTAKDALADRQQPPHVVPLCSKEQVPEHVPIAVPAQVIHDGQAAVVGKLQERGADGSRKAKRKWHQMSMTIDTLDLMAVVAKEAV